MQTLPASVFEVVGALIVVLAGALTFQQKLINSFRKDNKTLQDKVIDQAIPALNNNAEAVKQMVAATQQLVVALAVSDDRAKRSGPHALDHG